LLNDGQNVASEFLHLTVVFLDYPVLQLWGRPGLFLLLKSGWFGPFNFDPYWLVYESEEHEAILKKLEAEAGVEFRGDLRKVAQWARHVGLDVIRPPPLPK
jgi:hypothetical protein